MEKNEKLSNWVENAHTQVGGEMGGNVCLILIE